MLSSSEQVLTRAFIKWHMHVGHMAQCPQPIIPAECLEPKIVCLNLPAKFDLSEGLTQNLPGRLVICLQPSVAWLSE